MPWRSLARSRLLEVSVSRGVCVTVPWCKAGSGSVRIRRDMGAVTPHPRSVPSSCAAQFPYNKDCFALCALSFLTYLPESLYAWFFKDMNWGWRLQRPTLAERGLCKDQRSHGKICSPVYTALLPKATIRSDNSNLKESKHEPEAQNKPTCGG